MSEQEATSQEAAEAPENAETAAQGDPADEPLQEPGKKALAAEREARKAAEKAASELAAQLKQIENAKLSDLELAQQAAKEYEQAAAKASAEALRWRIAARHGIGDEDAETFLTGADEETLTRQAERLQKLAAASSGTPKPDLSQGAKGEPAKAGKGDQFAQFAEGFFTR